MTKLLYIQASSRGARSYCLAAADAFVAAYREANPGHEVLTINLFKKKLPAIDGNALNAKYAILHGKEHTDGERTAWKAVESVIDEFRSADKYVLAVPMWNFSIPYPLKHYLDVLLQPTYTFTYSPQEGYKGLVTGKPIFMAFARGGSYAEGSGAEGMDYQTRYVDLAFRFIGFSDIRMLLIEPTLAGGADAAKDVRAASLEQAEEMARDF
ncbi:MAG: FMN-dependent NADH-azoreductase [Planctomycetota bacterium]